MARLWPGSFSKESASVTLWEVDIHPAPGEPDLLGRSTAAQARDLGLGDIAIEAVRGFLVQGDIAAPQMERLAKELFTDLVVERPVVSISTSGGSQLILPMLLGFPRPPEPYFVVHVLPEPGVTDPVADSALKAITDFGLKADAVCTLRKYWVSGVSDEGLKLLTTKLLANDSIEQVIVGPLKLQRIDVGSPYQFEAQTVQLTTLADEALV